MLHLVDGFSQVLNPLFALALLGAAFWTLKREAPLWVFQVSLATLAVQQIVKAMHKHHVLGDHFPSTHFAFALAMAAGFTALNRRFVVPVAAYLAFYGVLMLVRGYHTPFEMLGALPALPLVFLVARLRLGRLGAQSGTKRERVASE